MTSGSLALLLGWFGIPLLLTWLGQRVRARTAAARAAFWGGVIGYGIGMMLFLAVALWPPVEWLDGSARERLVEWTLLSSALLGMTAGSVRAVLRP